VPELFVADEYFANCPMMNEAFVVNDQLWIINGQRW